MNTSARPLGRCLVTGAGGFIGRRLVSALRQQAEFVCAWTRDRVDMTNEQAVASATQEFHPDTVFHLASSGVSAATAHDPAVVGRDVLMAAHLVRSLPAGTRLISAGSMAEYGRSGVLSEVSPCFPRTAYAIGKHAAGAYLQAYGGEREVGVCVARLFGIFGPGESEQRFFPSLISALAQGHPFPMSDGAQLRDFVHVDDAVSILIALAQSRRIEPIVNVGTGTAVAIKDVAHWIANRIGANPALLRLGARPRSPGDEDLLQADITRLQGLISAAPPMRLVPNLEVNELFFDSLARC